jgi:hypothetical protein
MKQDAEAMYESMQQDGGDVESPVMEFDPYHNLAHYSDTFEHAMPSMQTGLVEAQFGGGLTRGQERRMGRRYNRMLRNIPMGFNPGGPGMFPGAMNIYTMGNMPRVGQIPATGSYYGGVQLANIDVRRTGLFGRPKEYTINFFSPSPVTQQDVSNVIKQEENNIKETVKEETENKQQEKVDTATDKNAEVQKEAGKETPTAGTTTTTTKKKESGKSNVVTKPVQVSGNKGTVDVPVYQGEPWQQSVIQQSTYLNLPKTKEMSFEDSPYAYTTLSEGKYVKPIALTEEEKYAAWLSSKGYPNSPKYRQMYNASMSKKQVGGFVDPSNPDLYKFIYGGADDIAIPMADGKLTNDPYFEYGGLVKAQQGMTTITDKFGNTKKVTVDEAAIWQKSKAENPEARLEDISFQSERPVQKNEVVQEEEVQQQYYNPYYPYGYAPNMRLSTLGAYGYNPMVSYAGSWAQQQGVAYDPNTGQPITTPIYNPALQSIDVKRTSWLTGAPKKYTMYFQGQGEPGTGIDKAYKPGTWYKGSDGQMHYTGDTSRTQAEMPEEGGKRNRLANFLIKSRLAPGLGADMITGRESSAETERSSYDPTGLSRRQRRADEAYREQFGNYPGEKQYGPINAPLRGIPQAEVPNLDILPGKDAYKEKRYGGILAKAQTGLNTFSASASDIPAGYFKDPVTGVIKNFAGEIYQPKTSLTDSQTLMTNPYKFEKNTATGKEPAIKMGTEGTYENTGLLTAKDKEAQSQQQMAVDVENKNMFNVDFQQGLDQFNKYGNMFAQMLEGKDNAAKQREFYDQLAAENVYGSTSTTDRGTYDVNSGLFRQDEMGFTGVIKYGGNIKQEGGDIEDDDYGYSEEEEVYMTPEEIEQFLIDGGDLEFI